MTLLLQLLINGLITGSIYALIGLGFALIYRGAKVFHIAHGAVYTAGAYALYSFYNLLNFPFLLAVFFALIVTVLLGLICEVGVYAPLSKREASPAIIIISSLGLYIIIVNLIALFFGSGTRIAFSGISPSYAFGNIIVTQIQIFQIVLASIVIISTLLILSKTGSGISIRAIANNLKLSEALGFDIRKIRIFIFIIGSLLVGIAAALLSSDVGMTPWGGISIFLSGAVAMIMGGVGSWRGAVLGGFLLGAIQAVAIWQFTARWQDAITFSVLILFLLFRPQGILGRKIRAEEL